jgi:hypothetical protein
VYHPQKRVGFGCTDGEGCERCWSQLLKEIPMLRVSGVCQFYFHSDVSILYLITMQYHRRLFIINQKLAHMNEQNFINLGAWWAQKMSRAQEKLMAAVEVFLGLDLPEPFLRNQWGAQCDAVTKQNPGMLTLQCASYLNTNKVATKY